MYSSLTASSAIISPVDMVYLMNHARLDQDTDESLLAVYATTATELVENYLSRYLLTRTVSWTLTEDQSTQFINMSLLPWQWSTFISSPLLQFPRPVNTVTSVTLGRWGQDDQTLQQGVDYQVDTASLFGRIRWISNRFMNPTHDHLTVVFTSGYGAFADIPAPILHAITLMTTSFYEFRGDQMPEVFTPAVCALLAPYRLTFF